MMSGLLGTSLPVFVGITVILMGYAAYVTGRALALTWGQAWYVVFYCVLMGCLDRFLIYSLFQGELLSLTGYVIDTVVLILIAMVSFRFHRAGKMVSQYPWLYKRTSLFSCVEKAS